MLLPKRFGTLSRLILWRLASVFLVQTTHVPDEYWQSLEVAHRTAFGYGYLTWEWTTMIRSYLYPFLISILYRILAILSLDSAWMLTISPRVFQAILVAYGDYRFYKWTRCKWMLLVLCSNWYWYYCATRTLINSVETACTTIALSIFPWNDSHIRSTKFLWIVAFLCMARPTATIIWFPLCVYHIYANARKRMALLIQYALICSTCLVISILIDSACYGTFVITPLRFFQANVLSGVGNIYGKQHTLWYVFAGLPVVLGLYYIPFLFAVWQIFKHSTHLRREALMLIVIGWTLAIYSLLPHKEFRFILPLLPILIYTTSACTYHVNVRVTEFTRKSILVLLIFSNVAPGFYFSMIHQRGTLDAMELLRNEISHANKNSLSTDTLILTPCHATPLYSHLHVNASVKFLTCEPNLENSKYHVDEADRFFANPTICIDFYYNYYVNRSATYVIVFDNITNKIGKLLHRYKLIAKVFHTHFPQSNYGKYILLYKRQT